MSNIHTTFIGSNALQCNRLFDLVEKSTMEMYVLYVGILCLCVCVCMCVCAIVYLLFSKEVEEHNNNNNNYNNGGSLGDLVIDDIAGLSNRQR